MVQIACVLVAFASVALGDPPAEQKPDSPPPGTAVPAKPDAPSPAGAASSPDRNAPHLNLTGISFAIPSGWESEQIIPGAMAPKAAYKIAPQKAGGEPGVIRISHYAEMKGKDDQNIDRWVGQVAKADGTPNTRADAKMEKIEAGNVRLTIVDLTGSVKVTSRDTARPDHRMIAAIVDHPKGPHFIVAAGPIEGMKTWSTDILNFIKSAKISEK